MCGWEDDVSQLRFPTQAGANRPLLECSVRVPGLLRDVRVAARPAVAAARPRVGPHRGAGSRCRLRGDLPRRSDGALLLAVAATAHQESAQGSQPRAARAPGSPSPEESGHKSTLDVPRVVNVSSGTYAGHNPTFGPDARSSGAKSPPRALDPRAITKIDLIDPVGAGIDLVDPDGLGKRGIRLQARLPRSASRSSSRCERCAIARSAGAH